MKITYSLISTFLFFSTFLFSQADVSNNPQKNTFGILFEGNYGFYNTDIIYCNDFVCGRGKNAGGFSLGILYQYQLSNFLGIRPQAMVSFNDMNDYCEAILEIHQPLVDCILFEYVALNFPIHFVMSNPNWQNSPKIILGGRFTYLLNDREHQENFYNLEDFGLDLGFGHEWQFQKFSFSPELVSTFGINDVVKNENLSRGASRNFVALRLIFRG